MLREQAFHSNGEWYADGQGCAIECFERWLVARACLPTRHCRPCAFGGVSVIVIHCFGHECSSMDWARRMALLCAKYRSARWQPACFEGEPSCATQVEVLNLP